MSLGAIKAGSAFVEITAKDATKAGVTSSLSSLKGLAGGLSSVAGMVSGVVAGISSSAIVAAVKTFADTGSELNDMAVRTGLAATRLDALRFAANQTGASLEDIEKALRHMAKEGMNVRDFEALGQQIAAIPDPSERAAAALEAFGKSGTKLIPMFTELRSQLAAYKALGPVLTEEEIKRADQLSDSIGALREAWRRFMQQVGKQEGSQQIADFLTGFVVSLSDFSGKNIGFAETMKIGREANQAANMASQAAAEAQRQEGLMAEADKDAETAAKNRAQIEESITKGIESRQRLIQEFETDHERFLRKEREIYMAIAQLNRNMLLGFTGGEQMGGLQTALQRLREDEAQRIANSMKQVQEKMPKLAEITSGSRGTFSARGAGLLGFGTRALVKTSDKDMPVVVKNLQELNVNVKGLQLMWK